MGGLNRLMVDLFIYFGRLFIAEIKVELTVRSLKRVNKKNNKRIKESTKEYEFLMYANFHSRLFLVDNIISSLQVKNILM